MNSWSRNTQSGSLATDLKDVLDPATTGLPSLNYPRVAKNTGIGSKGGRLLSQKRTTTVGKDVNSQ